MLDDELSQMIGIDSPVLLGVLSQIRSKGWGWSLETCWLTLPLIPTLCHHPPMGGGTRLPLSSPLFFCSIALDVNSSGAYLRTCGSSPTPDTEHTWHDVAASPPLHDLFNCAFSIGFSPPFCVSLEAHRAITAIPPFDYRQSPSSPRTPHGQILIFGAHPSNVLSVFRPPSFSPRAHCTTFLLSLYPILSCNQRVVA